MAEKLDPPDADAVAVESHELLTLTDNGSRGDMPVTSVKRRDSVSSESSDDIDHEDVEALKRIASSRHGRTLTSFSTPDNDNDPQLDPTCPEFDHRRWAQNVLQSLQESGITLQPQGVVFTDLGVSGSGSALQFQETLVSQLFALFRSTRRKIMGDKTVPRRKILHSFDGLLQSGELLLVLGRPGSGCTTFLKTICGHLSGLTLEPGSKIDYEEIAFEEMIKHHRGEVAYNKEVDEHFPHLTVGQTLTFAAQARTPRKRIDNMTRADYVDTITRVVMSVLGILHTYDTKVGNDFVRGVSGGERKRVSIAEMFLSRCRIGAWDNSTRGLDAASALKFVRSIRLAADMANSCHAVAAYQASQSMYDLFDKVIVLYEGQEIYWGSCDQAAAYFEEMGWQRLERQVAGDFLTSTTNPRERKARPGMESMVPRSPEEFAAYWKASPEYKDLRAQVEKYRQDHPHGGAEAKQFQLHHEQEQAHHTRPSSPYLLSIPMQIRLCLIRAAQRVRNDLPTALSPVVAQIILSLIIGSIFYNSPNDTSAFFQRGAVMFFSVLMNALITVNEIMQLYSQRPIVEKQVNYAFVHPFTEALASILVDLPIKIVRISVFSTILYFLTNLRREPAQFFIFYLILIVMVLTMSGIFRTLGAVTRTVGQAMAMAGVIILCIVVYTGFTLPQPMMHPWLSWIRWINPVFYAFEGLVSNEFHNRQFECSSLIPSYGNGTSFICSAVGAVAGERLISGDTFIETNYNYSHSHLWRNFGIVLAFMIFFHCTYLVASEYNTGDRSKAEALVFRPGHMPPSFQARSDVEDGSAVPNRLELQDTQATVHFPEQKDILSWKGVNYDIPVKGGTRRLLDDVNGWVKPGSLTALMGVSGAGKTTLLDVLAQRVSIGVVTGNILVNGAPLTANFPRRAGYVQQQDLHMETTTVREALQFSAMLRQSRSISTAGKYAYVEEVIKLLGMQDFAEAVVGCLGEGLNVEQRKLLSIGVELAARPTLLVFLDEPTSGLDSQSSWTICAVLRRLADHGQAVLATIHQPSALLFQTFDRLLFLAKGGKTVYFGDIGSQSSILLEYFERGGARRCQENENPAEYILEVVSGGSSDLDWVEVWRESTEFKEVQRELDLLQSSHDQKSSGTPIDLDDSDAEFAMPLYSQLYFVLWRVFQQYYRQPEYIYSKFILGIVSGLFIGFSFWKSDNTQQGFQDTLFSIFLLCTIFSTLVNQIMPKFVMQRSLYEVRERPSKVYSWKVFIISQMLVEVPWQVGLGICSWASFYFSVVGANQSSERQALTMLFIVQFYVYAASMAQLVVCAIGEPTVAAMLATLMFGLSFIFNGVMQPPSKLPGFWIFMYRVSPFTYYVSGISGTVLQGRPVECDSRELRVFDPPSGQSCTEYLAPYLEKAGGHLYNGNATAGCQYCAMSSADEYLAAREIFWGDRWRNYGIFWAYFVFNICAAIALYYLFRVRRWNVRKLKA